MSDHKWTGQRLGGDAADAGSYEHVRYCSVCGVEDNGQDSLPPCEEKHEDVKRANWVGAPEFYHLNMLCRILAEAFGWNNYHVGSSLKKRDWRDVDIRCILDDEEFDRIFPDAKGQNHYLGDARWSLICASISEWLSKRSGLPVDFQIQRRSEANEKFSIEDGHMRNAVGCFVHPRERNENKETQVPPRPKMYS